MFTRIKRLKHAQLVLNVYKNMYLSTFIKTCTDSPYGPIGLSLEIRGTKNEQY